MQNEVFERVYALARHIPYGKVTTYGQLGAMCGINDSRIVGEAMNASPGDVPWQRVINSRGTISIRGGTGERQRRLLEGEGVTFDENGRVDFQEMGWVPDPAWLAEQGYHAPPPLVKPKTTKPKKDDAQPGLF